MVTRRCHQFLSGKKWVIFKSASGETIMDITKQLTERIK
jgi:hypothetical protein